MYLKTNLKLLRQTKKLSQERAGVNFRLPRSTWANYENGTSEPPISFLIEASEYFGITLDALLKADLTRLGKMQLKDLENGFQVYLEGTKVKID